MIVVLDTNVWKQNLYLRSVLGTSLRLFLRAKGAKVGLPEVIRLEVERHLALDLKKNRERILKDHAQLLALFKRMEQAQVPTEEEIDALVSNFFADTGVDIVEVPFSIGAARESFLRTIDKIPPSKGSQQFKDGVIWANCKTLAETDDVVLVTDDRAFWQDQDPKKGLAAELVQEKDACAHTLTVLPDIKMLLEEVKSPVPINPAAVLAGVEESVGQQIDEIAQKTNFVRSGGVVSADVFATEDPSKLSINFEITYDLEDTSDLKRTSATMNVKGNAFYMLANGSVDTVQLDVVAVSYVDQHGEKKDNAHRWLYAVGFGGRPEVYHRIREVIEWTPVEEDWNTSAGQNN